jgi:hypothetical protein
MLDIVLLLDESEYMKPNKNFYINGINSLIREQKKVNPNGNFSLIKFNTLFRTLCIDSKIHTLPEFTSEYYNPCGMSSLYDAIGHVMNLKYVNEKKEVIIIILTNGQDNRSSDYELTSISDEVEHLKNIGWSFVYITANQNSKIICKELGIETCLTYNETGNSISHVAYACSVAIGHAMYKCSGVYNEYCDKNIPNDLSDLIDDMSNFTI